MMIIDDLHLCRQKLQVGMGSAALMNFIIQVRPMQHQMRWCCIGLAWMTGRPALIQCLLRPCLHRHHQS